MTGLVLALVLLAGTDQATAAMPWWKIHTLSAPAGPSAQEESVVVAEVVNLGDAVANKRLGFLEFEPMTVVDKLPAGVTATAIYPEGGGGLNGLGLQQDTDSSCSLATTTCTFGLAVLPYERMLVDIHVKVAPGAGRGVNEVGVSGGVAPPVVSRQALALEGASESYGIESYELSPEEEGGGPDTQAGSHPFQLTTSFALRAPNRMSFGVVGGR